MRRWPACWSAGPSRMCRSKASASAAGCAALSFAALAIRRAARWRRGDGRARSMRRHSQASSVRRPDRARDPLALTLGVLLIGADRAGGAVGARAVVRSALSGFSVRAADRGGVAVPAARVACAAPEPAARALAETVAAAVLALCAVFIVWNETLANWQALWFAAALAVARVQLASGTGRARLRISSATASADSAVL